MLGNPAMTDFVLKSDFCGVSLRHVTIGFSTETLFDGLQFYFRGKNSYSFQKSDAAGLKL